MELQEYHNLRQVEDSHFWFRSLHELVLRTLKSTMRGRSFRILDAGCGTGGLAKQLETLGVVECIDSSPVAIQHCQERGLAHARVADLNTIQLPANHYDVIVSMDVLYHRGIVDVRSVLRTFFTALKPGGTLFLHLPAFEALRSYHDDRVHTERRFRLRETKALLQETGFRVEHGSYRVTFLLPFILLLRLYHALSGKHSSDLRPLSAFINTPLLLLSRAEDCLSRALPLPFGLSLYVLAQKPVVD